MQEQKRHHFPWQIYYGTAFGFLRDGQGWFYHHAHNVAEFVLTNADTVRKGFAETAEAIQQKFDAEWSGSVERFQIPIFHLDTKGAWTLHFDDVIADALILEPLKNYEVTIPEEILVRKNNTGTCLFSVSEHFRL